MPLVNDDLIADLEARGLIHDSTDREHLRAQVAEGPIGIYYGCDPTADSLHVGNLIGLVMLRRFQDAGHKAIALAGGATGMIGDPSGKSEERNLLDDDTLNHNVACIKEQLGRIVDLDDPQRGVLVDNREWTQPISILEFLRDVGRHVTVNQMLARESIKVRINSEHGISFTEFSYMLLQANDYLHLFDEYGCMIQIGGSDQWGNIISGVDLIRRKRQTAVHAFSWPLLTASDGSKIGKTAGARVWLDPAKTSPYTLRQHMMQTADADVRAQLLTFSLRDVAEIEEIAAAHAEAPHKRLGQRTLATDVVSLVHSPEAAAAAEEAADLLFASDPTGASEQAFETLAAEIPHTRLHVDELDDPINVFVATDLAKSNGDARRTMDQGAYYVNGVSFTANDQLSDQKRLHGKYLLLRKGKKSHHLVELILPA
ncbi:tyrosyl-tRNA synthetase [Ilumatobacter coccineus YM16-304]|uniref:Tyrosine--tRNA ligase n=2 Tax=Ilumatobacter coccineus TaxID=467094 RepID=A0A6C7E325_ILUCY|nr:tyrosyl-tRNA synthetase [Ilumatobacter coccineus YM16-304]